MGAHEHDDGIGMPRRCTLCGVKIEHLVDRDVDKRLVMSQTRFERRHEGEPAEREASFEADLRAAADRYLVSLHSGWWSRGFDIHNAEGRARAVDHIVTTFMGIAKEMTNLDG